MNNACPHAQLGLMFLLALNMATQINSKLIEKIIENAILNCERDKKHVKLIKEETSYK
jgi:hypothetical protein